jgi:hypothetical protein
VAQAKHYSEVPSPCSKRQEIVDVGTLEKVEALKELILKRYNAEDDLNSDPLDGWLPEEPTPGPL